MPTTSFEMARWSYDIEGNALGYTTIAHSGGILPVYLLDGGPSLYVNVTGNEGHGNYDYGFSPEGVEGFHYYFPNSLYWRISRFENSLNQNPREVCRVSPYDYYTGQYEPPEYGLNGFYDLPVTFRYDGPKFIGRFNTVGEVTYTYENRQLAVTNFRTERPIVNVQSKDPFVKFKGDFTVYPNVNLHDLPGWKPTGDIQYRIKIKSPELPGGELNLDGVIPFSQITDPDDSGVIASFEHIWEGRPSGVNMYFEMSCDCTVQAITNVEAGNTFATAPGIRVLLTSCRGRRFQKEASFSEELTLFAGADSGVNPSFSYRSSNSSETPASMGYGWFSTENIKVFVVPEDLSLVYCDETGSCLRWLKTGTNTYEPLVPDNKVKMIVNPGSSSARYTVSWRDQSKRIFDSSGDLKSQTDRNGQTINYEQSSSYLKVYDDKGRAVYHHYAPGANQHHHHQ